ncbi:MAG: VWA domain-containing protein, partial [Myxococcales bacterium]
MTFPVELQDPRGLWLLGALVPLVALYVLKIRRARVPVGSTWLWAAARRDLLARSPWQRLVAQIPLLLQLLALALLALALARPATRHRAILGDHVAIILDTSASMGALDAGGQARIELAKTAAWEALSALSPGADAMLLEAAREPRLVAPLDRDIKRIQAALDPLPARDVEGDLGAAVALASERLRQLGGEARILVFTDGNLARPEALTAPSVPLEVFTVGTPVDNAGLVRVDVRAGTDPVTHQDEVQAFALLVNHGARPRDLFVTLRLVGATEPLASRRLSVAPGEKSPVVLTFRPSPGDRLKGMVIELSPHDVTAGALTVA